MDTKNMIGGIVSLAVVVICVAAIMMPVLSEATETTATLENDGYFHLTKYDTSTDVTIEWDHTTPAQITVNDTDYSLSTPINQWISLAIGDDFYIRYANGNPNYYTSVTFGVAGTIVNASTTAGTDLTVTCSGGTATATSGTTTITGTYTELYVISGDEGNYVMKYSGESVYMGADTEFLALGSTGVTGGSCYIKITGNIEDGANVTILGTTATDPVVSDIAVNYSALDDYVGYALSTITFTITTDETDTDATYSYFIVPAEVTLELAEHLGSAEIALLDAIPVLIIVSLVIAALGIAITSRHD